MNNSLTFIVSISSLLTGVVSAVFYYAVKTQKRAKSIKSLKNKDYDDLTSALKDFNKEKPAKLEEFESNPNVATSLYKELVKR